MHACTCTHSYSPSPPPPPPPHTHKHFISDRSQWQVQTAMSGLRAPMACHFNMPKAWNLILQHARNPSRSFLLNEMYGKDKTNCHWTLLMPILWSAWEFWETCRTSNNFTLSDFKDQWTVIKHSRNNLQNVQLAVTVKCQKCTNVKLNDSCKI